MCDEVMSLRSNKFRGVIVVVILVVAVVAGVVMYGRLAPQQVPVAGYERIDFKMDYLPKGQHVPYWVALENGYYDEEKLLVTIINSQGSLESMAALAVGKVNFTIIDMVVMATAMSKDPSLKMKAIAIQSARCPVGFVYRSDHPITSIQDVKGKTIGNSAWGAQVVTLPILLRINGIDPEKDVNIVSVNTEQAGALLAQEKIDVFTGYLTSMPKYVLPVEKLTEGKFTAKITMWSDLGMDYYAHAIVASESIINAKPDVVKRFLRAIGKATVWSAQNEDKASEIMYKYKDELTVESIKEEWRIGQYILADDYVRAHGLGFMNPEKVKYTLGLIAQGYNLKTPPPEDVYTNSYLDPSINLPADWKPPYSPLQVVIAAVVPSSLFRTRLV